MNHKMRLALVASCLFVLCAACSGSAVGLRDGYYTAETATFNEHGWKEFVSIYVSGGAIITVEYDAFNASGFARSWDMEYMRIMNTVSGTYPNEFTRMYAVSLINWQEPAKVDAVSGATDSYFMFKSLAQAAINQARAADKTVALVELENAGGEQNK